MIAHAKDFPKCIAFEVVIGCPRAFLFCNNLVTFFFPLSLHIQELLMF